MEAVEIMGPQQPAVTATVTCEKCAREFITFAWQLLPGRPRISPKYCGKCLAELEAEFEKQRLLAGRLQSEEDRANHENYWARMCPKEFRLPCESEGITDLERLQREQPKLAEIMKWSYQKKGLIIRGETGKCKTRCAYRLLRREHDAGRVMEAMTAAEFDRQCRDAGGSFTLTAWFNRLATIQLVFIDDLGKASWTPATEAQWFDLVDKRTREHLPIIITTNDDGDSLMARLSIDRGAPLIRRLRQFCTTINLDV